MTITEVLEGKVTLLLDLPDLTLGLVTGIAHVEFTTMLAVPAASSVVPPRTTLLVDLTATRHGRKALRPAAALVAQVGNLETGFAPG